MRNNNILKKCVSNYIPKKMLNLKGRRKGPREATALEGEFCLKAGNEN